MAIDPTVLKRQREFVAEVAPGLKRNGPCGPRMTDKLCPRCLDRHLAANNKNGVCYECWIKLSRPAKEWLRSGKRWPYRPERRLRRADPETIAKARAALEARGINVEAA